MAYHAYNKHDKESYYILKTFALIILIQTENWHGQYELTGLLCQGQRSNMSRYRRI